MDPFFKKLLGAVILIALLATLAIFIHEISPVGAGTNVFFQVKRGDGFRVIASNLYGAGLIRSPLAFEALALGDGAAANLQPGLYRLSPAMSSFAIMETIVSDGKETTVTLPEGSTVYDIDRILSNALVIRPGELIATNASSSAGSSTLEGKLFPDTYEFFTDSDVGSVVQKLLDNFNAKAAPLLAADPKNAERDLIIASIVQKEVASSTDQAIVAGILEKRLAAGIPLDIDATICYIKEPAPCYPLAAADFKIDSPYNTYLYRGLPPGPIGNPGIQAIEATLHPESSPYFYYLSDPATGKTIYAVTLQQQNANRIKYLTPQGPGS